MFRAENAHLPSMGHRTHNMGGPQGKDSLTGTYQLDLLSPIVRTGNLLQLLEKRHVSTQALVN